MQKGHREKRSRVEKYHPSRVAEAFTTSQHGPRWRQKGVHPMALNDGPVSCDFFNVCVAAELAVYDQLFLNLTGLEKTNFGFQNDLCKRGALGGCKP